MDLEQIATKTNVPVEHWTAFDRSMMARALDLAIKGQGLVSPGPLVGCVIATGDQQVVGEGFYVYEAIKHAETIAIEQAGEKTKGATAYVSLEPHAHHGRTGPCTDALIAAGITRVLAPIDDPNPKVSGKGFEHLRQVGIQVETGLMAHEASRINEKYLHFMRTCRPFVHLKLAASLDGKIATRTGESRWITGEAARRRVHELRNEYDAILVGAGTACTDDPLLTDRSGKPRVRSLLRVVLDRTLRLPCTSKLAATASQEPVLIITGSEADDSQIETMRTSAVEVFKGQDDILAILEELGRRSIQSLLVEGGAGVAARFLEAGLVNKVTFFLAPTLIGGSEAPGAIGGAGAASLLEAIRLKNVEVSQVGSDLQITGYPPST